MRKFNFKLMGTYIAVIEFNKELLKDLNGEETTVYFKADDIVTFNGYKNMSYALNILCKEVFVDGTCKVLLEKSTIKKGFYTLPFERVKKLVKELKCLS